MEKAFTTSRRTVVKSSIFGLLAVSIPSIVHARQGTVVPSKPSNADLFHRYPSIDDEIVAEVVGASHSNFDRVKELVDQRPELSRATWDWAFGDWETALGAASHVGRRDIAEYLMSKGARPDIFTYAMLGNFAAVQAMITATPGVQRITGPHGISLLQHAKAGLRPESLTAGQRAEGERLVVYLESLGDADPQALNLEMPPEEKEKYLGDYMYGQGESDGLSVKLNMRKLLSLGKLGQFGGGLYQQSPGVFSYNGFTSVEISFEIAGDQVRSLTIHEPGLVLRAVKV